MADRDIKMVGDVTDVTDGVGVGDVRYERVLMNNLYESFND